MCFGSAMVVAQKSCKLIQSQESLIITMLILLCDVSELVSASALIKFIWTSGGTYNQITSEAQFLGLGKPSMIGMKGRHREMSSSENSVSMEATNSEDEQVFETDSCVRKCCFTLNATIIVSIPFYVVSVLFHLVG
jgi:hypothetical protein